MESRRDGISISQPRRSKNHPSFSSTLLDAIYRSIDEMDDGVATNKHLDGGGRDPFPSRKKQGDAYSMNSRNPLMTTTEVTGSSREYWSRRNPSGVIRTGREQWRAAAATSSSSDVSSYGGFSSSEAESVSGLHTSRHRPIRTGAIGSSTFPARLGRSRPAAPPSPPPLVSTADEKKGKKERHGSIRSRLMRELRKGRAPASPGSRLANFLNSLFTVKSKDSGDALGSGEDSACSTASSYSRSCLSKMSSSSREKNGPGKRTVRFCPTGVIVDADCRPCGQKLVDGSDPPPKRDPAPVRTVTESLRRSKMEEEEDDGESDSSSDLFELDNLAVIGRFDDELPVYETTSIACYRGISHGLLM